MTGLQLATAIAGGLFLLVLIALISLNTKRKNKQPSKKSQITYGKMWNWIIPIGIISALVLGILIAPRYFNDKKESVVKLSIPASYVWKKKDYQYGKNPNKRTSGYLNATITEDNDEKFCFIVHVGRGGKSYYDGRKLDSGKIEGNWRNPPNGGDWRLEIDKNNPKLYKGEISDLDLDGWAYLELLKLD